MIVLGVAVAGAVGAVLRFLVDRVVQRRASIDFPVGILVINVTGAFLLGVITAGVTHHHVPSAWTAVVGTGLLGAFTTFSSFTYDAVNLMERQEWGRAGAYLVVSLVPGLLVAAAGLAVGAHL